MPKTLKQVLETGTFDRLEEYRWRGKLYFRVFVVGEKKFAWDGPESGEALRLIDDAYDAAQRKNRRR